MRHRAVESVREHRRISRERGRGRTWFVTSDAFVDGSPDGTHADRDSCERLVLAGMRVADLFVGMRLAARVEPSLVEAGIQKVLAGQVSPDQLRRLTVSNG
jgi:hypothetical protein